VLEPPGRDLTRASSRAPAMAHARDIAEPLRLPSRRLNTRQAELREALDKVLEQRGDTTLSRALESRWHKRPRPLVRGFGQYTRF
jgi:hypothetical protein